jgi:hypothetical protein
MAAAGARLPHKERSMTRPSPRRAAAALALAGLALLLPAAGHAAPRPDKTATAFERIAAGPLSSLLDHLATLLRPGSAASKSGSSLDPDGATGDSGSKLDPNGATSDSGSRLDPDGRT